MKRAMKYECAFSENTVLFIIFQDMRPSLGH